MIIMLVGQREAGKTTLCVNVLPRIRQAGLKIAGFLCPPRLDAFGQKIGIRMLDVKTGENHLFAVVAGPGEIADVGRYRLIESSLAWARDIVDTALRDTFDWLIVDEIGPLELQQGKGFAFILDILANPARIRNAIIIVRENLATGLALRLKRDDLTTLPVTERDRDQIADRLMDLLLVGNSPIATGD